MLALVGITTVVMGAVVTYVLLAKPFEDRASTTYTLDRISRHMVLPKDEEPALLTITDRSKLRTKFLQQAQNGDKVLVYQNNQRAIIYRPSIDRIVDVGIVQIDNVTQQ